MSVGLSRAEHERGFQSEAPMNVLPPPTEHLQAPLHELLALERAIRSAIPDLLTRVPDCGPINDLLTDIDHLAACHVAALEQRLRDTLPTGSDYGAPSVHPLRAFSSQHSASSALQCAYAMLQEAVIRYTALQSMATRARDSWVMADEGTSAHIGRQHTQDYVKAAGWILALVHEAVLLELDNEHAACRCTCPACGIGVCACAVSARGALAEAWMAAGHGLTAEHGVVLPRPRPGSAAAAAGLHKGDLIVAIDGQRIDSTALLARLIRDHQAGDMMAFTVRRAAGEVTIVVEQRREGIDINEDECALPSGQDFYLDQAKEVRRRLRRQRGANQESNAGLTRLSTREIQVLGLLAQGAPNPVIAAELKISRATVANHVATILRKLDLVNRTEAAGVAARFGLQINI
jgi:DNA-binding CsgD family transcriptional regulator